MQAAVIHLDVEDLSKENLGSLTRLLSRRPNYGIARPSQRWQDHQQKQAQELPKALQAPKSVLHRLSISIRKGVDSTFGSGLVPLAAVMCSCHHGVNPFFVRRLFEGLAREATIHSDRLRTWPGKSPVLAAFVTRIDSINAYWLQRADFEAVFGAPPHDDRFVTVESGCEACILAAVGGNGRTLADLRAQLQARKERYRREYEEDRQKGLVVRKRPTPRLLRVVNSWIGQLAPEDGVEVRRWSDQLLAELRAADAVLPRKQRRRKSRSKSGWVGSSSGLSQRGTGSLERNKLRRRAQPDPPMPRTDKVGAAKQRQAAGMYSRPDAVKSVYRPDSLVAEEQAPPPPRPAAPQPFADRLSSNKPPSPGFVKRFEREIPLDAGSPDNPFDDHNEYVEHDAYDGHEGYGDYDNDVGEGQDERDLPSEERSRHVVTDWYDRLAMAQSHGGLGQNGPESIHPAFQDQDQQQQQQQPPPQPESCDSFSNPSAVPEPLRLKKDTQQQRGPRARWSQPGLGAKNERASNQSSGDRDTKWTDVTVHTAKELTSNAPPIPPVSSRYRQRSPEEDNRKAPTSRPQPQVPKTVPNRQNQPPPRSPPPKHQTAAPKPKSKSKPLNNYLFQESDCGSRLTATNKRYLRAHRNFNEVPREQNPFATTERTPRQRSGPSSPTSRVSPPTPNHRADPPRTEQEWRAGWGANGQAEEEDDGIQPDDSASNVQWWTSMPQDAGGEACTELDYFLRKGGEKS